MPKIKQLEIKNFRNIDHVVYDLTDRTAFSGKNFIGKSNSLQAIHWLLSDYLIEGSQDIQSIKPLDDTAKEVSVMITLDDDTTIEKTYSENWVKTRGTDEVTLQGHTTTYFINGIKQARISDAVAQIRARLGLDTYFPKSKIDPLRMLINPLYLVEQVDWKILRNYIIELVGDVSDEDVINANLLFESLRQPLSKFMGKTDHVIAHYKGKVKAAKQEIYKSEVLINELQKVVDVDEKDLAEAKNQLAFIDQKIAELQLSKANDKNPRLAELDKEIVKLIELKNQSIEEDRAAYDNANKEARELISKHTDEKHQLTEKLNKLKLEKIELESKINNLNTQIKTNLSTIESNELKIKKHREDYIKLAQQEFVGWELPQVENCPHCGGVLNDDVLAAAKVQLEKAKADFEKEKAERLEKIVEVGNALKLENQNLEFKSVDLNNEIRELSEKLPVLEKEISDTQAKIKSLDDEIYKLNYSIKPYINSEKTNEIISQIAKLREEYTAEQLKNVTESIDEQIKSVKESKAQYQKMLDDHAYFVNTQAMIKDAKVKLSEHQKELTDAETILMLTEEFIRTKLNMLDKNVEKVFGNIKFKLIENNIKEGSYNEVCYPLILGKNTPYANGSTSEKIITGVAIIEAIRKHVGLPELPIIFDEAESLDSETLVNRLNTNCQIITARVDDKYTKPTAVEL